MDESPYLNGRMSTFGRPSDLNVNCSLNSSIMQVDKILQEADPDETGQAINFITYDQEKGK